MPINSQCSLGQGKQLAKAIPGCLFSPKVSDDDGGMSRCIVLLQYNNPVLSSFICNKGQYMWDEYIIDINMTCQTGMKANKQQASAK